MSAYKQDKLTLLFFLLGLLCGMLLAVFKAEAMPREPDLPSMFEMNCYTASEGDRDFHTCRFGDDVVVLLVEDGTRIWRLTLTDYDTLSPEFIELSILMMYETRGRWLLGFDPTETFRAMCRSTRWEY